MDIDTPAGPRPIVMTLLPWHHPDDWPQITSVCDIEPTYDQWLAAAETEWLRVNKPEFFPEKIMVPLSALKAIQGSKGAPCSNEDRVQAALNTWRERQKTVQ